jgi:hypothetical protein
MDTYELNRFSAFELPAGRDVHYGHRTCARCLDACQKVYAETAHIISPDGRLLVISSLNWEKPGERGLYVMDPATSRELSRWPWMLIGIQTSEGGG